MSMHRCVYKCIYLHVLEMRGHRPRKTKANFYSSDLFRGVGFGGRSIYSFYLISNHFLNFPLGNYSSPSLLRFLWGCQLQYRFSCTGIGKDGLRT